MKRFVLLFLILSGFSVFGQEDAWVYFKDKPGFQQYLDNPLTMLTQRSLDRRTAQNIALDMKDVPVYQPYIDAVEAEPGIAVMAKSKWFNTVHVRGAYDAVQALLGLDFVDHVDYANRSLNTGNRVASNHLKKSNKIQDTEVNFNYGSSFNQIQMLNGNLLHQQDFTGSGKIIAIMDGGFPDVDVLPTFSRIRDNNQILGGYNFVNRDSNFYTGVTHGTLILSTIAGYLNNQLVGTAPDASYYLFVTEDGANESPLELSNWVEAAEEADRLGVDIISTSLGYTEFDNPDYNFTYQDMDGATAFISKGVDVAYSRGMICVVAAGNEGNADWHYISAPADATHALSIGAVNPQGIHAAFSSYGPSADGRVKPDVVSQGEQAVYANMNGVVTTGNGTSFSAPIIAGMVACFWQAVPDRTNEEIMQYIKESASIYANPNDELGYGIPDFGQALFTALGTQAFTGNSRVLVYPNPFSDHLSVALPSGSAAAHFVLYNSIGQKVLDQQLSQGNAFILSDDLQSGVYLYKIESNANTFSQSGKLVKR